MSVPLARAFVDRLAGEGLPVRSLSEEALRILTGYRWPGNVRELRNLIERAAIFADDEIRPEHLSFGHGGRPMARTMAEIERRAIEEALAEFGGNRTKAAKRLGISLRTLQYRLKDYAEADRSRD